MEEKIIICEEDITSDSGEDMANKKSSRRKRVTFYVKEKGKTKRKKVTFLKQK